MGCYLTVIHGDASLDGRSIMYLVSICCEFLRSLPLNG